MKTKSILFVCMGNICRSPTAEGVFRAFVKNSSIDEHLILIDSAGTIGYHVGEGADPRSIKAAKNRGYDLTEIRSRQVENIDFVRFDLLIAMDNENYKHLIRQAELTNNHHHKNKIKLFLDYSSQKNYKEVPDPYYAAGNGFDLVIDLIEDASKGLLAVILKKV